MKHGLYSCLLLQLVIYLTLLKQSKGIHLKGTFKTNEFFKFIGRFGFQKTDVHNEESTKGYIYGNISLVTNVANQSIPIDSLVTLAVLDYNYFIDYYKMRHISPKSSACALMFDKINTIAYFYECNEKGKEDFIRRVPCPKNKQCYDEDDQTNVVNGNQFTFRIRDINQARFWYISLNSCNRDTQSKGPGKCEWNDVGDATRNNSLVTNPVYTIAYDIWVVNGNPDYKTQNHFEHQYTYELHDIFEIYLTSLIFLIMILVFVIYRIKKNFHHLNLQLLVYIVIEVVCRIFSIIHNLAFSYDGEGVYFFEWLANFLEAFNSSVLVLILISIAKGWTVRSKRLKTDKHFFLIGLSCLFVSVASHMISMKMIDPVFNTNPYETTAGYVELSVRFLWMAWFLYELKATFGTLETVSSVDPETNLSQFQESGDMQINEIDNQPDDGDDAGAYELRNNGKNYVSLVSDDTRSNMTKKERLRSLQIFYLHYGALSLVWFIYTPCLIFITSFVSELYRLRLNLGIRYLINYITIIVLIYIIWSPSTPLKLPGKKKSVKSDIVSKYIFDTDFNDNENDNEESVLFTRND